MIKNYFKIAWRNILKNKVYSLINIAGLALSMTCGILIFTLVSYHLNFDNFHHHSDKIYRIVTEMHRENINYNKSVPAPLGKVFRDEHTFGEITARIVNPTNTLITLKNGTDLKKIREPEGIAFTEVGFFDIFNYPLLQGNKKKALSEPNTAIITEKIAAKYFGSENPIGKQLWLENKIIFTVTGVLKNLPTNTDRKTEIFASYNTLRQYNDWLASDESWGGIDGDVQCFTLLRPNITVAQAENAMAPYVKKYRPISKNVHHYKLQPLADIHFSPLYGGKMEKQNLWILGVIALFLVLTACVNFINLATAQALKRSKEVGVRKVLGGEKRQIFWQFISETAIITLCGMTAAVLISYLLLPYVNIFFNSEMSLNLFTNSHFGVFVIGLFILVTFFAGSYPGLILSGFQPVVALKGKLAQQNIGGFNIRRTLIISQFAISQVLIIGMIVIINQMRYVKQTDMGFDKNAIVMIDMGSDSTHSKYKTLKNNILAISGVEKVSVCRAAPATGDSWYNSIKFDNQSEEVSFRTSIKAVDEAYISTFGLELIAGKNLYPSDTVKEFLVNETFTKKLNFKSPNDAIGKMISADGGSYTAPIVGIVKDFHDQSLHEEINAVALSAYNEDYNSIAVKINLANVQSTLAAIEKAWLSTYSDQLFEYEFLDQSIANLYETEERMLKLIQFFSFIAIFIGCMGLYGLVSFMVANKTKEIGIRKILGGSLANIFWIFGKEFLMLITIAFIIAGPIGWYMMNQWLQNFKFRINLGVGTLAIAVCFSILITLLTVSYQAIRAAVMNPVKSLKTE